jgi:Fe-S-cluster containining protein
MPLSNEDIEKIKNLGFHKDTFVLEKKGELQLRNQKGDCVFLDQGICSIYKDRPKGCKLYPLIFDEELKLPSLDNVCPYKTEFKITKHSAHTLLNHLKQLTAERKKRLK